MVWAAYGDRGIGGRSAEDWFEHGVDCEKAERLLELDGEGAAAAVARRHLAA